MTTNIILPFIQIDESKYPHFIIVHDFKELFDYLAKDESQYVDTLVLVGSKVNEDKWEFNIGCQLAMLYEKKMIQHYIYISNEFSTTINCMVQSVHGKCYDDLALMDEEEDLIAIIEMLKEEEYAVATTNSFNIITDFIQGFIRNEACINTPFYIQRVQNALSELSAQSEKQTNEIIEYTNNTKMLFKQASDLFRDLDKQRKELKRKLKELEENMGGQNAADTTNVFSNSVTLFNPYQYTKTLPPLVVIKEYTPCKYLTSFIISYVHYLRIQQSKNVKLLFLIQGNYSNKIKYDSDDYSYITKDNMKQMSLYENPTVMVTYPIKEVLRELTEKSADLIIVVDRLYQSTIMFTGRVQTYYAVGGAADVKKFNINDASKCIFSSQKALPNQLLNIPMFDKYPDNKEARLAVYSQLYQKNGVFEDLSTRFKIND